MLNSNSAQYKDLEKFSVNFSIFWERHKTFFVALGLCSIYWIYLIFNSNMAVMFDALDYEGIGRSIYEHGWPEYFRNGPQREPFYPWTIAVSMDIAGRLGISYLFIQRILQVISLFITQVFLYILLGKLNISPGIKLGTLLYFGFSPGLVNAAMSLFSEIMIFPSVPLFLLAIVWAWRNILHNEKINAVWVGVVVALTFLLAIFNKGIFQYVFLAILMPFGIVCLGAFLKRKKKVFVNSLIFLITAFVIVQTGVNSFKWMNKKYNGHFEFTNRYTHLLFGNAYKRSRPLTSEIFWSQVTSIPGAGVCRRFFNEERCRYADFYGADYFRGEALAELITDVPKEKKDAEILRLTFKEIFEHPFQYIFFMGLEFPKMLFWESTQIGFVEYPLWLQKLFVSRLFKDGIRLVVSLMTIFSLIFVLIHIYQHRSQLGDSTFQGQEIQICFFAFLIIFIYAGLYSFFSIVTRYALPLGSLYVMCIAYTFSKIFSRGNI